MRVPLRRRHERPDGERLLRAREIVVAAILANPVVIMADPATAERLEHPEADVDLEALGFDSLARLEFAVHLAAEYGIEVSAEDVDQHRDVAGLTRLVAAHL